MSETTEKKDVLGGWGLNPLPAACHARTLPAGSVMIARCSNLVVTTKFTTKGQAYYQTSITVWLLNAG